MNVCRPLQAPPELGRLGASLITSLPLSFRRATFGEAAVATLVDGRGGWPQEVAALLGDVNAGTLVVIDPGIADPAALRELTRQAERAGQRILMSEPIAGNPQLRPFANRIDSRFHTVTVGVVADAPLDEQLLTTVRLARTLGRPASEGFDVAATSHAVTATARDGSGATLKLSATRTRDAGAECVVRCYGAEALAELRLPDGEDARPALASVTDVAGCVTLPTLYETAHRATLCGLADQGSSANLDLFADDIETALRLLGGRA